MQLARSVIESLKVGWVWLFIGAIAGAFIPANGLRSLLRDLPGLQADAPAEGDKSDSAAEDDHKHVLISELAGRNMKLRTGRVKTAAFVRTLQMPGTVRERPALSDFAVSTRVQGVVTDVYALPGQAVRPGQRLFRIDLTGEELAAAQSELLDAIQQLETTGLELERLSQAAKEGGVPANKVRMLTYDQKRYRLLRDNKKQELMIRGLTEPQVEAIIADRTLLRQVVIAMPEIPETVAPAARPTDEGVPADELNFTIEDLHVHPGRAVKPADKLCDVAYHTNLYFEGQAFEKDVELIRTIAQSEQVVGIDFGTGPTPVRVDDLRIVYIDNHVDPESQTFRFYIPLPNQILGDVKDGDAVFRSWRFKPGQRGHVQIPLEELTGHFPLPREAVLVEGPDAFVFRQLPDDHVHEGAAHDHSHDKGREYEPVPVHVVFHNEQTAVVAAGDELHEGDRIAMNRAYDLQLALKSGTGAAHAHDHPHPH